MWEESAMKLWFQNVLENDASVDRPLIRQN